MDMPLLEVHPEELKFIFRPKKICWSSMQLTNNTHNHVAFKVKTSSISRRKFSVRPNMGIIEPKSTCKITIRMQREKIGPPNMICRDNFLIKSTVVPAGTAYEDISFATFAKDGGKYIEEKILVATFVSPSSSPTKEALREEMAMEVSNPINDKEGLKMIEIVEELKLKVTQLESKLSQVNVTISELEGEKEKTKFLNKNHRVPLCSIL